MARLAYGSRACSELIGTSLTRSRGGFLEGCESPHPCDNYVYPSMCLRQSGRNTASHVITGNIHLSMQYYVVCGSTTHIVLRRAEQVDISKGDGNFSHTSYLTGWGLATCYNLPDAQRTVEI